jgi:teichuronic acid biosynthesis glycosyltransferase TuaG
MPDVSVVMPAYNASAYIDDAMASVLGQSHASLELIVIDDASSDATRDHVLRAAEADRRVRLIALPRNMGAPAGPRNIGIREARGRWVALLDADDLWHPRKLEWQLRALARTGARFCSSRMVYFTETATAALSDAGADRLEWISFLQQLLKLRTPLSSVLAERALFLAHPFDESPSYKAREDLDCWLHIHEDIGRSVKIKAPLMGYRVVAGQISGNKGPMLKRHLHVLQRYRLRSGRSLKPVAWFFTATHFGSALYYRFIRKGI